MSCTFTNALGDKTVCVHSQTKITNIIHKEDNKNLLKTTELLPLMRFFFFLGLFNTEDYAFEFFIPLEDVIYFVFIFSNWLYRFLVLEFIMQHSARLTVLNTNQLLIRIYKLCLLSQDKKSNHCNQSGSLINFQNEINHASVGKQKQKTTLKNSILCLQYKNKLSFRKYLIGYLVST